MIRTVSGIVLLILHLTVCILIWAGIRSGMLKVKKYLIIPVIFVPVWGALSMLILHLQVFSKAENSRKIGIEKLQVNEEIYKNNFRLREENDHDIVPLEEALLINDPEKRRKLIMDILNDDPSKYIELLEKARMNEDAGVYPVINGSVFYLDDFPSPVPGGDGTYVRRDYNTNIADFYSNIWWPDMMSLAAEHGVRYTGVMIENYEDETDGKIKKQTDTQRFQYFGNMILHQGGELGYHGYNHQPLSLSNVDYGDVLPYKTWISMKAIQDAFGELIRFGKEMFPGTELSVYVPPSNVLSEEGRKMLAEKFPEIRTIASNYFPGEYAYVQEFETADDGIVEQPRIISGAIIDDYMQMAALSELNMHFVNSHFMHPDDLLDEDRGAALGWEKLRARLDEYMTWMNESAPSLRNLTGSELAGAVQRYGALTVDKEITDQEIRIHLGNFYDEAYLMVRINDGTPGQVTGGELTNVTGNLYLLHAQESEVVIERN